MKNAKIDVNPIPKTRKVNQRRGQKAVPKVKDNSRQETPSIQGSVRVFPTFLLKGVDPMKIVTNYKAGLFFREKRVKEPIEIIEVISPLSPSYSDDQQERLFVIKDRNNMPTVMATSNHSNYITYRKTGSMMKNLPCFICFGDVKDELVGYPIFFYEKILFSSNGKATIQYHFLIEGSFCSFECALRFVRKNFALQANFRDKTMRESERLMLLLFELMYPGETLREAQDPFLLESNGGSLTREEWNDKKHVYLKTDRIVIGPAKVEYVRSNFIEPKMTMIDVNKELVGN